MYKTLLIKQNNNMFLTKNSVKILEGSVQQTVFILIVYFKYFLHIL